MLAKLAAVRADKREAKRRRQEEDDDKDDSGTGWRSRRSGKATSGSELIEPEPVAEAEAVGNEGAGNVASRTAANQRLSVETLSGYGEAAEWTQALKQDLALWRDGGLDWSAMSTRILLSGPPGTGKTTFAKALCNTLQVPLMVTSVATWLEPSYLGDVLRRMKAAFDEAEKHKPVILFIDEIDALGKRQPLHRDHADYWNTVVNRALELLDGVTAHEGIIVVGATNKPDTLDPALLRSGRLERQVEIGLPDTDALVGILAHHIGADLPCLLRSTDETGWRADSGGGQCRQQSGNSGRGGLFGPNAPAPSACPAGRHLPQAMADEGRVLVRTTEHEPEPNAAPLLRRLAARAVGSSGADIERLVREARGIARREGRALAFADLEALLAGSRPKLTDGLRRRAAVHEAGHAVVRQALGIGRVVRVTIAHTHATSAHVLAEEDVMHEETEDRLEARLAILLAGRVAEQAILGTVSAGAGGGGHSDLAQATRLAVMLETAFGFGGSHALLYRTVESEDGLADLDAATLGRVHRRLRRAERRCPPDRAPPQADRARARRAAACRRDAAGRGTGGAAAGGIGRTTQTSVPARRHDLQSFDSEVLGYNSTLRAADSDL